MRKRPAPPPGGLEWTDTHGSRGLWPGRRGRGFEGGGGFGVCSFAGCPGGQALQVVGRGDDHTALLSQVHRAHAPHGCGAPSRKLRRIR
jgi:hypothetical protein